MSLGSYLSQEETHGVHEPSGGILDLCVGSATVLLGLGLALIEPWIGLVVLAVGLALWAPGTKRLAKRIHPAQVPVTISRSAPVERTATTRFAPAPAAQVKRHRIYPSRSPHSAPLSNRQQPGVL
jgi:uncharacterized membrane protein